MTMPAYLEDMHMSGMHYLRFHDSSDFFSHFIYMTELAPGYESDAQLCITRVGCSKPEKVIHMTDSK